MLRDGEITSAIPGTPRGRPGDVIGQSPWDVACLVAALFRADPIGTGLHLKASPGPVRDRFLAMLPAFRRCPSSISDERLWGGLDLPATLAVGQTVTARGLLAEADGGVVAIGSAERMTAGMAARLGGVLDEGEVLAECCGVSLRHQARIGLLLLDEGLADDAPPPASLLDRLAFRVDLDAIKCDEPTPTPLVSTDGQVDVGPALAEALCATADALGVFSARATLLALRVTRTIATLKGRSVADEADAARAATLVLAHRATRRPSPPEASEAQDDRSDDRRADDESGGETSDNDSLESDGSTDPAETILAAAIAALPSGLLDAPGATVANGRSPGRCGALRGRPLGARAGRPGGGDRLALIDTLRAAAPWQRLRPKRAGRKLTIRGSDLHVRRFEARSRTTIIFVVDASGSAAMNRLAEAKGAVELLLADCYVRRDQVALITFRGRGAELLLPPSGALARARRCLASMPGGGGTPLAAGLDAALTLASALRRRGESPFVVVLTDGKANVARDGTAARSQAMADAAASASMLRAAGMRSVVIDISPRPQDAARTLAASMGARVMALPQADAASLSRAVQATA